MRIGIDLDDVLAEFLEALIAYHNERYGTTLRTEDFMVYRFWEVWGGTRDEAEIDILIEDSVDYAKECADGKRKVLLFERPWNRLTQIPDNIIRVRS